MTDENQTVVKVDLLLLDKARMVHSGGVEKLPKKQDMIQIALQYYIDTKGVAKPHKKTGTDGR